MFEAKSLKVAVEGCCHGELDSIYNALEGKKVDLLLICGDFQAIRNKVDLDTMSVPDKYKKLGDFHDYYSGAKVAPVLTIFIGGNHESSSYLKELKYGGWVAPNIYYLGEFGCVWFKGLQIGGISGIYNQRSFVDSISRNNSDEKLPYNAHTIRSIYHVKAKNYLKMYMMDKQRPDIILSHDWPQHIEKSGNVGKLIREKPFFRADINNGALGSPLNNALLYQLKPRYWFSSHLHVRFQARVKHSMKRSRRELSTQASKKSRAIISPEQNEEKLELEMDDNSQQIEKNTDNEIKEQNLELDVKEEGNEKLELDMDMDSPKEENHRQNDNKINNEALELNMDDMDLVPPSNKQNHPISSSTDMDKDIETHFLALDKCLPRRKFLEILDIKVVEENLTHPSYEDTNATEMKLPELYHDRRTVAINKVIESFINSNLKVWNSIHQKDFYDFAAKQADMYNELNDEIQFELAKLNKLPNELFQIHSNSFKPIAPMSSDKDIRLKYWENNQTVDYCSKFQIPYNSL